MYNFAPEKHDIAAYIFKIYYIKQLNIKKLVVLHTNDKNSRRRDP